MTTVSSLLKIPAVFTVAEIPQWILRETNTQLQIPFTYQSNFPTWSSNTADAVYNKDTDIANLTRSQAIAAEEQLPQCSAIKDPNSRPLIKQ